MSIERQIRTKAWLQQVKIDGGFSNPSQIATFMSKHPVWCNDDPEGKDRSRSWGYYEKLERFPSEKTLYRVKEIFSGTLQTFEEGPKNSSMFTAMFSNLENEELVDPSHKNFYWVFAIAAEVEDYRIHNFFNTITILNTVVKEDSLTSGQPEISANSALNFLAGCMLAFRTVIENTESSDREVSNAFELVYTTIKRHDVQAELVKYHFLEQLMNWLKQIVLSFVEDFHRMTPIEIRPNLDAKNSASKDLVHIARVFQDRAAFWEEINDGPPLGEVGHDIYGLRKRLKTALR